MSTIAKTCGFFFAFRVALPFLFFASAETGLIFTGIMAFGFLAFTRIEVGPRPPVFRWLRIYLAWAVLSLLWTPAPFATALGHWGLLLLDVLIASAIFEVPELIIGWVAGATALACLVPFMDKDEEGRIDNEALLNPHNLGPVIALALLFLIFRWRQAPTKKRGALGLFLFSALVWSGDKTSLACTIVAALFMLVAWAGVPLKAKLKGVAISLLMVGVSYMFMGSYLDTYLETDAVYTLTGRTLVWEEALERALDHPIIGNGFYASRELLYITENGFDPGHAHNEWLQAWLTLGVPGLVVLGAIYWNLFRSAWKCAAPELRILAYCLLIYALLHSLLEAPFDLSMPMVIMLPLSRQLTPTVDVQSQPTSSPP